MQAEASRGMRRDTKAREVVWRHKEGRKEERGGRSGEAGGWRQAGGRKRLSEGWGEEGRVR